MAEGNPLKKPSINYQGNSHKSRESTTPANKKEVHKLVEGSVVQRKKTLGRKISEAFTGDDAQSVGSYVLMDVLLPAAKSMISDAVSQGIERMLFGESRPRSSSSPRGGNFVSYNRMHSSSRFIEEPRKMTSRARATHDFGEIVLDSRGEAESIIDALSALIDEYDVATVSDLYKLVGITGSFTDDLWGWADLRGASVQRVRDGYLLNLPSTITID